MVSVCKLYGCRFSFVLNTLRVKYSKFSLISQQSRHFKSFRFTMSVKLVVSFRHLEEKIYIWVKSCKMLTKLYLAVVLVLVNLSLEKVWIRVD